MSDQGTCCPPLNAERWDNERHQWEDKPFIRDAVCQLFHIPLDFGPVITRMWQKVEAGAKKVYFYYA